MDRDRWEQLSANDDLELTQQEYNDGWHWCVCWDGLLVGPEMQEAEWCECILVDQVSENEQ